MEVSLRPRSCSNNGDRKNVVSILVLMEVSLRPLILPIEVILL